MLKKNLFFKKFTKLLLSITKGIESFFNLFKGWKLSKKNNFNTQKRTIDKKIFIILASIFIAIIVYFLLPSFYDKNKVKAQLENKILQKYNFKVKLNENISYGLFPRPHFLLKDVKIEHDSKEIAISKNTKFFISSKNFFLFNEIEIKNLVFTHTDFKINQSNLNYFFNLFNNKKSNQNILFIKSKFFYVDQSEDVIFFTNIKKLNYLFSENFINEIDSKLEIFNVPINFNVKHDILNKNIIAKVDLNSLRLNIKTDSNYDDNKSYGQLDFDLINNKKTVNYILNDKNFTFNTDDKKLEGTIYIKPFFLSSNLDLEQIEIKNFFQNDSIAMNLLRSEILNNKNFNGKISIFAKNLKDSKFINKLKFDIQFEEGRTLINNLKFAFKNSIIININDINIIIDNNKLKFIGEVKLDFKDIKNFYSHFQIKKNFRKNIKRINSNFEFYLDDGYIELNELRINGINNKILNEYLNNFNSEKKDILNKIVFRNTLKEFFEKINLD
tara:strand:+ start:329 stop:1825 length:1497 start_codon:yes stop_codon:yes gene_type:complete